MAGSRRRRRIRTRSSSPASASASASAVQLASSLVLLLLLILLLTIAAATTQGRSERAPSGDAAYDDGSNEYMRHLESIVRLNGALAEHGIGSAAGSGLEGGGGNGGAGGGNGVRMGAAAKKKMAIADAARHAFDSAVSVDPDAPQAYALMAKFWSNAGRYDLSLRMWDGASDRADAGGRTPPEEAAELRHIVGRERRRVEFAVHANALGRWDASVAAGGGGGGAGNPMDALEIVGAMLAVYPSHPRAMHDLATFSVLVLDSPPETSDVSIEGEEAGREEAEAAASWEALRAFEAAQEAAFAGWSAHRAHCMR